MDNTSGSLISPNTYDFLSGGGEMGKLIRLNDWSESSLGPIHSWPQSLRTTLSLLLSSKLPMFLWWGPEYIQFYNDSYSPSLVRDDKHPGTLGQPGADFAPETWPVIRPLLDLVLTGGEAYWKQDQLIPIHRNGRTEEVYWTFNYSSVRDESGQINGVLVVCNETTEKVINTERLSFAIEATELGTWDYNPFTGKFTGNVRLKEWFGLSATQETDLMAAIDVIAPKDQVPVTQAIQRALEYDSGGLYDIEYSIIHPVTKTERIVRAKGRAWFNEEKIAYRFNGTLQDITKDILAQKQARESELLTVNIIQHSEAAQIVWLGEQMVINMVNEKMLEILGKDPSITGKPFMEVFPEQKESPLMERIKRVLTTGETFYQPEEMHLLIRNGQSFTGYYNYSYKALKNDAGENYGIICTATEVTEQVLAKKKVELEKERANLAIAAGELGVFEVTIATNEIVVDKRFNEIYGFVKTVTREEYITTCHPDDLFIRTKALDKGLKEGIFDYETRFIHQSGAIGWLKTKGHVIYDEKHNPVKLFGVVQDITEQKQFSEALARQVQERTMELNRSNEDLLQFAHVASHDLKEPVRKIKTFAMRIQDEYSDLLPEKGKVYLDKVNNATERMFSMIEGVLNYSALSAAGQTNEQIDLNSIIRTIEGDLEILIQQKNATIKQDQLPAIEGAFVLIYQLFYNLINNSLKFSKPHLQPLIAITSSIKEVNGEKMAEIIFTDNGIGINPEYAGQIFNAFTRLNSKDNYEGTGLGLALCKKITERHHGKISATGIVNECAIFTVLLPLKQTKKIS